MANLVTKTIENGVATLTLNRPEKLNALSSGVFCELENHLKAIAVATDEIGLILLKGAGRGFCAGLDLDEAAGSSASVTPLQQSQIIDRLGQLPQPVIAAVHGICYTGGLELALACDMIVAAESARFADTHSKWGLTPIWGMSQRLPRRVGRGQATRMGLTAATIDAPEALRIGLVELCFPDAEFDCQLTALTTTIIGNSWFTHRANKRLFIETDGLPLISGLAHEVFRRSGRAPDWRERVVGFGKPLR